MSSPRTAGLVTQRKFRLKHNIAEVSHDRVDPVSLLPNKGDRALSFFVPRTSARCVDFSHIQLHLRLRLVSGVDGKPLNAKHKFIVPGFIPSTIFGSLAVRVNDTEITNACQLPLLTKFLFLTQLSPERRVNLEQVNHFVSWDEENVNRRSVLIPDEKEAESEAPAEGDGEEGGDAAARVKRAARTKKVWDLGHRFTDGKSRSHRFTKDGGRGTSTFSTFLMTELCGGGGDRSLVLPPCDLSLDFLPADAARCILTDMPDPDVRVEILDAHLTVPRVLPKDGVIPRALRWNYLRTKVTPIIIPKDRTEFHAVVLHSGLIGRRISLMLLDHDNWEGTFRNSIYRSHNFNVESVELQVGSRVLPTSRIRADFEKRETNEMYLYVLDSLKWSLRKTQAMEMLEKSEWEQGAFFWSADATVDRSADAGYKGQAESGSVNLSINFRKKTPDQLVAVIFTEATAELRIDSDGSVNVLD